MCEGNVTDAFSAVVGLEGAPSCGHVTRQTRAEVAALSVGAAAPLPADISHVLTLVVVWMQKKKKKEKKRQLKEGKV